MAYRIQFKSSADKDFENLPDWIKKRISIKINQLSEHPFPFGVEKLKGNKSWFRIRAGDYRIVYEVESGAKLIIVHRIRHRREVYRNI